MTNPAGESSWINYVNQQKHNATDVDSCVALVEHFRHAVSAEPGSMKIWVAYCEYFWSLYADCSSPPSGNGWSLEELELGRQVFSLDAAINLWQEGYEAVQYRLSDSHELWDRWIAKEMELLSRTRTEQGVRRITQLFKNRLQSPHATWDNTSQNFSTFLSQYNQAAYEQEMLDVTKNSKEAKRVYGLRDGWEMKLNLAKSDEAEARRIMLDYLGWEILGTKNKKDGLLNFRVCLGLFSRALTGLFSYDEDCWHNYLVFVSSAHSDLRNERAKCPAVAAVVPNLLEVHQRAVRHVPWSGAIWARYILSAEEAGLSFSDIERIKHAATNSSHLDRDGMMAVLDMYAAWCGYLKRTAMNPNATEESIDLAEVGLPAALEDVMHWGRRRYGDAYQGDPNFRLEKILIQFLTEKKEDVDAARAVWTELSVRQLHANSYDFWLHWYLWEMVVFAAAKSKARSPTPSAVNQILRVPKYATQVFHRALKVKTLDWPERVMEVFLQHCNDYELPDTLREALDTVYKTRRGVAKRREREAAQARAAAAEHVQRQVRAHAQAQAEQADTDMAGTEETPLASVETGEDSGTKRKRESTAEEDATNKRAKSEAAEAPLKRDREHSTVFLTNLPSNITETKIKKFFHEYGSIKNIDLQKPEASPPVALIEFNRAGEAQTALIREGKKIDDVSVSVTPATDCTLWVTNYAPEADEDYIRKLFKGFGQIHSIRFPSKKYNSHRRFCYVTYRDPASAAAASAKLDGKRLDGEEGKYKLQAKISNPAIRQQREGALAEKRELHISGMPNGVEEKEVRDMFGKMGTVERVRIVTNRSGFFVKSVFVDMQTKEMADEAVEKLNKSAYRGHILTVEISKPKPTRGPEDSGTDGQAQAQEEADKRATTGKEKAGEGDKKMTDMSAKKEDGVSATHSGQPGKKAAPAKGLMAPSPMIRRPVLGAGGKRGMGFVASKRANGTTNGVDAGKKSNDDFKKMFLEANGENTDKE